MVCLEKRIIKIGNVEHPISRFDVWWIVSGKGLFTNLLEALEVSTTVIPAPVAVADNGMYEVLPPELSNEGRSNAG